MTARIAGALFCCLLLLAMTCGALAAPTAGQTLTLNNADSVKAKGKNGASPQKAPVNTSHTNKKHGITDNGSPIPKNR